MQRPSLEGHSILIVEDEPLIVMDITQEFEATGAALTTTNTLKHAVILVEHDGLSGAILDHALPDGDSSLLCARLKERGIPFLMYSGLNTVAGACAGAPRIAKPAAEGALVAAMERLFLGNTFSNIEIGPLLVEQRRISDEFRVVERSITELHGMLGARNVDPADRIEMELGVISRTEELMGLGKRMLELDAAVTVASLKPS
jgi:DNA-binding response OmpR family regulator